MWIRIEYHIHLFLIPFWVAINCLKKTISSSKRRKEFENIILPAYRGGTKKMVWIVVISDFVTAGAPSCHLSLKMSSSPLLLRQHPKYAVYFYKKYIYIYSLAILCRRVHWCWNSGCCSRATGDWQGVDAKGDATFRYIAPSSMFAASHYIIGLILKLNTKTCFMNAFRLVGRV